MLRCIYCGEPGCCWWCGKEVFEETISSEQNKFLKAPAVTLGSMFGIEVDPH